MINFNENFLFCLSKVITINDNIGIKIANINCYIHVQNQSCVFYNKCFPYTHLHYYLHHHSTIPISAFEIYNTLNSG